MSIYFSHPERSKAFLQILPGYTAKPLLLITVPLHAVHLVLALVLALLDCSKLILVSPFHAWPCQVRFGHGARRDDG